MKNPGRKLLSDSSKSPEIALAFSLLENAEVYLLISSRNPRAVAVSWAKKHDAKTIKRLMTVWKSRQQRLKAWKRKRLIEHYVAMRYEDFTPDPKTCISQIQLWLGSDNWLNNFTSNS